jgi:hypothetical protein
MRWLAYVHPGLMIGVLALALFVLREGLQVRRARVLGNPFDSSRHQRWARILVVLVALGFALGLASLGLLRGRPVGGSVHFPLALASGVGITLAGALGTWLARGAPARVRVIHAACGAAGVLLGIGAAIAGLAILP